MTHKASWRDLSASSKMRELAPRQSTDTVNPAALTPVTLTTRAPDELTSSTRSADPSLSSVNESMSAIGLHPVL